MGKNVIQQQQQRISNCIDSQYLPEGGDLSVHHLSFFRWVSVQLQQVSFSKQRAEAHHLLVPVKTHEHKRISLMWAPENYTLVDVFF